MSKLTEDIKGMKRICCICKKEFYGYGNNPEPYMSGSKGACCDECNLTKVVPMRIKEIRR